jgi:biopolymer transport protein ExbB
MSGLRDRPMAAWMVVIAIAAAPACSFRGPFAGSADAGDDAGDDAAIDGAIDAPSDWWNPAWSHRRQITIRNDELTGTVQSFPLLVRLPAEVLAAGSNTGDDLRFLAADQTTVLPYQLDTLASPSGVLVWVRIPMLTRTGTAPVLWVYYGNPTAPRASNGVTVFGDLFASVHHLDNDLRDATDRNHTAAAPGAPQTPSVATGRIGGCRDFDGTDDYLTLAGNEADFDFTAQLSVSAWIRVANLGPAYQAIVTKGDSSWRLHRADQTAFIGFGTNTLALSQNSAGDVPIDGGGWHHVAIVFGGSTKRIFVDGALDQADAIPSATINTNAFAVALGRNEESTTGGDRNWNGDLDEVRISAAARDEHWMFAEHHTVVDADFVGVGGEETAP